MRRVSLVLGLIALLMPALVFAHQDKAELAKLAKLDKAQALAKATYLTNKKNVKLRHAYVNATMAAGDAYLVTPAVGPRQKYPKALRYYREVRKIDPKHADAKKKVELIEGIYRSMGKPIPPG